MSQRVVFAFFLTLDPDVAAETVRHVVNASTGIGMDALQRVVADHIPSMDDRETLKEIIYTDRYECPCCSIGLSAIVRVTHSQSGPASTEDAEKAVRGLYHVSVDGYGSVRVSKWSPPTEIFRGSVPSFPNKHGVLPPLP